MKTIHAADLFCGAGGTSTGLYLACDVLKVKASLLAVNHWPVAIATHSANHQEAVHLCHGLDGVDPRKIVPGGRLHLLVASPECTHHSNARGGRPMSDQSRASAWHVVRWMEALHVDNVIVENVREFLSWGPLGRDGRPLKKRKGELFEAWLAAMRALGYTVDHRILNAADYGDPTTRERLFVIARRSRGPIAWPKPTHSRDPRACRALGLQPWRAAREIIDWSDQGTSIFNRKKPLALNTIKRIAAGMRKFNGWDLEPFLLKFYGTSTGAPIEGPVPSVTAQGGHLALVEPYQIRTDCTGGKRAGVRSIDDPTATVVGSGGLGVVQPEAFLLGQQSGGEPRAVSDPAPTVAGKGAISAVTPFMVPFFGERDGQEPRVHSIDEPAPAVTSHGAGGIVEPELTPFISEFHSEKPGEAARIKPISEPLPTQTTEPRFGLAQPFLLSAGGPEVGPRSTEEPANTVLTRDHMGIAQPFVVGAGGPCGAGQPQSIEDPLKTVLAENHKAIIVPVTHQDAPGADPAARVRSADQPLPTVTGARRGELAAVQPKILAADAPGRPQAQLVDAFLVQYNGTADARSVDRPVGALTAKPRYALLCVFSDGGRALLDIRFRMLKPRELARAQGFPDEYQFTGKTEDVVKQIGNAVPVHLAKALCLAVLS